MATTPHTQYYPLHNNQDTQSFLAGYAKEFADEYAKDSVATPPTNLKKPLDYDTLHLRINAIDFTHSNSVTTPADLYSDAIIKYNEKIDRVALFLLIGLTISVVLIVAFALYVR